METINNLSQNPVIISLSWTLFHSIWQAALLVLAGSLLVRVKNEAYQKYRLLSLFHVLVLITSFITFFLIYDSNTPITAESETVQNFLITDNGLHNSGKEIGIRENVTGLINENSHYAAILWIGGVILISLKSFFGFLLLSYARKTGSLTNFIGYENIIQRFNLVGHKIKTPQLLESALCKIPMLVGVLKPAILLPVGMINNLPNSYVEAVIAHELAHLVRKDNIFIYLQKFVDTIFFFNPSVYIISGMINREREILCDEMAVNLPLNKIVYAKALAFFTEYALTPGYTTAALYNGENQLFHRIQKLTGVTMKNDFSGIKLMISILIVSAGVLFASSSGLYNNAISDTTKSLPEPAEVKEVPPLAVAPDNEPEIIKEVPPTPELKEIPPLPEVVELPPAPGEPALSDSVKHVISFEEITGIPYKNVKIETDENNNVLGLWIEGEKIPEEDYDQYGDLFKKAFRHYDEENKRLAESMAKLGVSMAELEQNMEKLESLSNMMEMESADLQQQSAELERQAAELELQSSELEKESARLERQSAELEKKSYLLEEESAKLEREAEAHEVIHNQMISDGLIKADEAMKILLTKEDFYINGVKQPDSIRDKYIKLYIRYFGEDVVNKAINMERRRK